MMEMSRLKQSKSDGCWYRRRWETDTPTNTLSLIQSHAILQILRS